MESVSPKSKLLSVITVIKERKCRRKYVYKSRVTEYLVKTKETATTNITKRVCMNKKSPKQREHTEKSFRKYSSRDRIVPTCFRSKCKKLHSTSENDSIHRHHKCLRPRERVVKKGKQRVKKAKCESNKRLCKKHCQYHHKKKSQKDFNDNFHVLLSPISLSPLMDNTKGTLSYDDISSDTMSTYSTSRIDRLIKKTRERERRSLQEWPLLPKLYSNGNHGRNTDSSDVESFHSAATLVIDSQTISKNVDAAGPKIKEEKIDKIDYMQQYCTIKNIKTEVINDMGAENSLQPCKDEPINRESYLILQSGEITTNVLSPVENFLVINRE